MLKFVSFLLVAFLSAVIFVSPVRDYMNNLSHRDKRDKAELKEEQTIGIVSGYNPTVKEVQEILKKSGFNPGPIDGLMGNQTRIAIREFQKKNGLRPTGKINSTTHLALNREKETIKSLPQEESEIDASLDMRYSFLTKETALETIKEDLSKKAKAQDEVLSSRLKSKDRVRQIQAALQKAGFYKGEIDGKIGPQTKRAIKNFQKAEGLEPDGIVGLKTWEKISIYMAD